MNKKVVLLSFVYKFIERLAVKGAGLIISILLARMLAPEIFGTLALIMVFINLSQTFVQSGLGAALVQSKKTEEKDYSIVLFMSLAIAILCISIIWVVAPYIANYYNDPNLEYPLKVYSFSLVFGAFNSVQTAKLQREMKFKPMMVCNTFATCLSGALGLIAAYMGFGLWALIIYSFAQIVIVSGTMCFVCKWKPQLTFSLERAKELYSYGWKMLVSALLCSLYGDIRSLIIGKKYTSSDLGVYNRGQQLPNVLANTLDLSIQSVMFPVLSKLQDSKEDMRTATRRTAKIVVFFIAPTMIGMAATADSFVPLLLTDKWNECIPFLKVFCFAEMLIAIVSVDFSVIKASGKSGLYMRLEIIRRSLMTLVLILSVTLFDQVIYIVLGYLLSSFFDTIIMAIATKKVIDYSWFLHIADTWKSLLTAFIMGAIVYGVQLLLGPSGTTLFVQIIIGITTYVMFSVLLRNDCVSYISNSIKKHFKVN